MGFVQFCAGSCFPVSGETQTGPNSLPFPPPFEREGATHSVGGGLLPPTGGVAIRRCETPQGPWQSVILHRILPVSKLYTTSKVLSSGENFKMLNFVRVLSNFAPVLAPPFAPGGLARTRRRRHVEAWPARDSPRRVRPGPGLRPEGSLPFPAKARRRLPVRTRRRRLRRG